MHKMQITGNNLSITSTIIKGPLSFIKKPNGISTFWFDPLLISILEFIYIIISNFD